MALRTIQDASFHFKSADGPYVLAMRGETHDIPEEDIIRGEKCGSFTAVPGEEPRPPEGSFIPKIELDWSEEDFVSFVDAGTTNEILERLGELVPEVQPQAALSLIQAEQSRGETARGPLLVALQATVDNGPKTEEEPEETEAVDNGALAAFVESNTVEAVIAYAGSDPEMAEALSKAEQARGDKARKSLVDALAKIS